MSVNSRFRNVSAIYIKFNFKNVKLTVNQYWIQNKYFKSCKNSKDFFLYYSK